MADKQVLLRDAAPALLGRLANPPCVAADDSGSTTALGGADPSGEVVTFACQELSCTDDKHWLVEL